MNFRPERPTFPPAAGPVAASNSVVPTGTGTSHVVEYRISVPFLRGRYYFAFFGGRCQRSPDRVVAEGQRRSWRHVAFSFGTVFLMASTMLMCGAATIYLAKSMLGIDLFQEHSFLHHLFFD